MTLILSPPSSQKYKQYYPSCIIYLYDTKIFDFQMVMYFILPFRLQQLNQPHRMQIFIYYGKSFFFIYL